MSDHAQQSDLSLEIPATIYGGRVPAFRDSLSQDFVSIADYPVTMCSSQKKPYTLPSVDLFRHCLFCLKCLGPEKEPGI